VEDDQTLTLWSKFHAHSSPRELIHPP